MRQTDFDQDWEAASQELLTGMKEWRFAHPHATLTEMEQELDQRMNRLRATLLGDMAQASDLADLRKVPTTERPKCPVCGCRLGPRGQKPRRLTTSGNETLVLERSYAMCSHCGVGFFPPR